MADGSGTRTSSADEPQYSRHVTAILERQQARADAEPTTHDSNNESAKEHLALSINNEWHATEHLYTPAPWEDRHRDDIDHLQKICEGTIAYILRLDDLYHFNQSVPYVAVNIALRAILNPQEWGALERIDDVLFAKIGAACLSLAQSVHGFAESSGPGRQVLTQVIWTAVSDSGGQLSDTDIGSAKTSILQRVGYLVHYPDPVYFVDYVYPPASCDPLEHRIRLRILDILRAALIEPSFFRCSASEMVAAALSATWRRIFSRPWAQDLNLVLGHPYADIEWIAVLLQG